MADPSSRSSGPQAGPTGDERSGRDGRGRRSGRRRASRAAPGRAAGHEGPGGSDDTGAAQDPPRAALSGIGLPERAPGRHVAGATLSAFLDDELGDDAALKLTRHVTACPTCRAELEALRGTRSALRRLRRLQAPVLRAERRSLPKVRTWSRRLLVVVAVVTLAAALLILAYVLGGEGEVVPPVERFLVDHLARTGDGPVPAPFGGLGR